MATVFPRSPAKLNLLMFADRGHVGLSDSCTLCTSFLYFSEAAHVIRNLTNSR